MKTSNSRLELINWKFQIDHIGDGTLRLILGENMKNILAKRR